MAVHRRNAYIDYLLQWENRHIVQDRLYRDCFRHFCFSPDQIYQGQRSPGTGESYYTYSWEMGGAPANVEIDVVLDRYPPRKSGLQGKSQGWLHNHDFFEILYVYSGSCTTVISGKECELSSGDICLYNLQAIHRVWKHKPDDVIFNIVIRKDLFQKSFLDLLAENDLLTDFFIQSIYSIDNRARQIVFSPMPEFHCEEIVQQIIERHYRQGPMEQSILKALLLLLLGEMTCQYYALLTQKQQALNQGVTLPQVIAYINQHCETVTLEELSSHFGYTLRSMTRYIKASTGTTFKKIVQQIRFYRACQLLCTTGLSIESIAVKSGYAERASFDRAFKQAYHVTPREYRLRYQNRSGERLGPGHRKPVV